MGDLFGKRQYQELLDYAKAIDLVRNDVDHTDDKVRLDYYIQQARKNLEFFRKGAIEGGLYSIAIDTASVYSRTYMGVDEPIGIIMFYRKDKKNSLCDGILELWFERETLEKGQEMLNQLDKELVDMGYKVDLADNKETKLLNEGDDDEG